ncbi:MAG: RNA polymerase sigma factor [Phycisphaerales bacterium]|nr:RNA polymerase sigma factor [Phycisphaerales bacterium]
MARAPQAILDDLLVLEAQRGRPDAWRALVGRWHPLLLGRAVRLLGDRDLAADAVQDAWASIARGITRLEDPARFAPWAYRILARRCADHVRRAVRRPDRSGDVGGALAPPDPLGGAEAEPIKAVRAAISTLPGEQRLLLTLRYADGVPLAVIADLVGTSEGTVKSRLHTARAALRRLLEPRETDQREGANHGRA